MSPIWAIQTNAISHLQAEAVAFAVMANEGKAFNVEVIPSLNLINFVSENEPTTNNVIPYGSTKFVELAIEKKWLGVFHNTNFSVPIWNEKRTDMLNHDSVNLKVEELLAYIKTLPDGISVFIRPTIGKKIFPGMTATVADIVNWVKTGQVGRYPFSPETEVTIARIKNIQSETRWFVVNGKVIDGSTYRLRGHSVLLHVNNETYLKEAQQFADVWLPHPTCVMDLASTEDGTKVIEFNTFNSSGFYNHDIPKIIRAIESIFKL